MAVAPNLREDTQFSMERGMRIMSDVQVSLVHERIISAVNRIEFVSDRMLKYISWSWCTP
jgi:hypothetical protein